MKVRILILVLSMVVILFLGTSMDREEDRLSFTDRTDACTDIVVGRAASADGSVITSHTGCCEECRVHVVPAQTYPPGTEASVYYGLQDVRKPLKKYGKIIGTIPQVEKTYAYFHTGYSQMNEHQLAIGESTLSQRDELKTDINTGRQILSIEMAQVFALQRCRTAREAIRLITSLVDEYGFLPSCGPVFNWVRFIYLPIKKSLFLAARSGYFLSFLMVKRASLRTGRTILSFSLPRACLLLMILSSLRTLT